MEKHCDNCMHITSARLCMENEENPWCDNFEEYFNKTHWTPLTSQEQLDEVWEDMEEMDELTISRKLKNLSTRANSRYIKHYDDCPEYSKNTAYTILTPYTGENK